MPLHCPHCGIAQAEGDGICINCGQPLRAAPAPRPAPPVDPAPAAYGDAAAPEAVAPNQERRSSWKLPALIAAVLLLASAVFVARRGPAHHSVPVTAAIPAPKPLAVAPPAPSDVPALPAAVPHRPRPLRRRRPPRTPRARSR